MTATIGIGDDLQRIDPKDLAGVSRPSVFNTAILPVFFATNARTAALTPIPPTTSPDRPMSTKKVLKTINGSCRSRARRFGRLSTCHQLLPSRLSNAALPYQNLHFREE